MAKTLAERITSARSTDRVTIADLAKLVDDIDAQCLVEEQIRQQADDDSLRLELSEEDRDEAAVVAHRAQRTITALRTARDELQEKLERKRQSERRRAEEADRAAIIAERDALAERLRSEWPQIEAQIFGLLCDIKSNDAKLPPGEASAEAIARGMPGNFYAVGPLRRLTELKLPSFDKPRELIWPVRPNVDLDHERRAYMSLQAERVAEEARWKRYAVKSPLGKHVQIETRKGPLRLSTTLVEVQMTNAAAEAARAEGCDLMEILPGRSLSAHATGTF